ncbi:MAG: alpha/beta hydrolase [Candidatus Glassbacteria bacterium]
MKNADFAGTCRLFLLTIFAAGSFSPARPAETVVEKPGVRYSEQDKEKSLLDLYLPQDGRRDRPGVLLIHGGGWRGGDRGQWRELALLLAGRGFVCASAGYRLAPGASIFEIIGDVRRAMDFLKGQADQFGLDPGRVGAVGSSAGGHLVALLGTIPPGDTLGDPAHAITRDTRPQAVACYNPVLDFAAEGRIWPYPLLIFGRTRAAAAGGYETASPARRVGPESPPFLFLYGDRDDLTPEETSRAMATALAGYGIPVEVALFHEMAHGFGYRLQAAEQRRAAGVVAEFFERYLK